MSFLTLVIILLLCALVIVCCLVLWFRKDPIAADHALDEVEEGAEATGGWLKRMWAKLRGK